MLKPGWSSRRRAVLRTMASAAVLPCALAGSEVRLAAPRLSREGYRKVQDWDFVSGIRDQAALRRQFFTRYIYDGGRLDHLNDEWSRYRDDDNHRFTPEGLALVAHAPGEPAPGTVSSGMLRSRWTGQYGIFEARLKLPSGRGLWPAFWLNPQNGRWPPEIDVVEVVNNGVDTTQHSFHFVHGKAEATKTEVIQSSLDARQRFDAKLDLAAAFHDYAVEWTPERVRHYIDDRLVIERRYLWRHDDGSDAGPAHLLLNLGVGGKWPGPPGAAVLPASLLMAHLRVWQR